MFVDPKVRAVNDDVLGLGLHNPNHPLDRIGQQQIIGIDEGDIPALSELNELVASGSVPAIRLPMIRHGNTEILDHLFRAVGRAVIDDDNFIVFVCLTQNTLNRLFEILLTIVRRDADADHLLR